VKCEECGEDMVPMDDIFDVKWKCPNCGNVQEEDFDVDEGAYAVQETIMQDIRPKLLDIRVKLKKLKESIISEDKP